MAESSEDSSEEDEGGAVEIRPRAGAQGAHQVGFCLFFACLFVCFCLSVHLFVEILPEGKPGGQPVFLTQQSS